MDELKSFSNEWGKYFARQIDNHAHNDLHDMRVTYQMAPLFAAHASTNHPISGKKSEKNILDC